MDSISCYSAPVAKKLRLALCGAAVLTVVSINASYAQDFPEQPVTVIVPYAAGGGTDVVARLLAKKMGDHLKVPVVIENRAGAGGAVGTGYAAKARPDGYTVLMGTASTHAINPALHTNLSYDPVRDFEPVILAVSVPMMVVVNAQLPYKKLGELTQAMQSDSNKLTFGSQGVGGIGHLAGEMLNYMAKGHSLHVPYKGAAPALQDLVAGNIDILYDTPPALLPQIKNGKIRALAVASSERVAQFPDIPTTAEAGLPGFKAATWNALFVPKGTPADVIAKLAEAASSALQDPDLREQLGAISAQPGGQVGQDFKAFMLSEVKTWAEAVKMAGLKPD